MEIAGYLFAVIIGISLGLIGGGGSILTVPVMVYLFGINPVLATAYSLFVVGTTSLVGSVAKFRVGLVDLKTALVFGIPSFLTVYLTRLYLVPAIPEEIISIGSFTLSRDVLIMVFFSLIMFIAAISMIRTRNGKDENVEERVFDYPRIILDGLVVGLLTGIVGAGGGFLIIPALVLLSRLPMKLAVGTSLTIIAAKSLLGFVGDIQSGQEIEWEFLLFFTALAIVGIFAGTFLSRFVSNKKLKSGFGWFVLVMSIYILLNELVIGQ
ncbi:MAG: sulfite exporter TauE/SafE family protein [Cyclobacteriaceae bacterium]